MSTFIYISQLFCAKGFHIHNHNDIYLCIIATNEETESQRETCPISPTNQDSSADPYVCFY